MKVIIVGAGFVGMQLARTLVSEGRDVVLIDKDADRVREAGNSIDCSVFDLVVSFPVADFHFGKYFCCSAGEPWHASRNLCAPFADSDDRELFLCGGWIFISPFGVSGEPNFYRFDCLGDRWTFPRLDFNSRRRARAFARRF